MILNYSDFSVHDLLPTDEVITELIRADKKCEGSLMIVGAECRNLIHESLGFSLALRSTSDLDVAIGMNDWDAFARIAKTYPATGDSGMRFLIEGFPVDVMPFGNVEAPEGKVDPPGRGEDFDVFGMRQVFEAANIIRFASGSSARLPTPEGYAALKIKAWIDRSARYETKDARDMSVILYWYHEAQKFNDELFNEHIDLILSLNSDIDLAAAHLLGLHITRVLGEDLASELSAIWSKDSRTKMAREMRDQSIPRSGDSARNEAYLNAVHDELTKR